LRNKFFVDYEVDVTNLQRIILPSKEQIVAAIYETVLRPELFSRFIPEQRPDSFVGAMCLPAGINPAFEAPELQAHFARALEILEQQWHRIGCPNLVTALAEPTAHNWGAGEGARSGLWLLIDLEGRLLRRCDQGEAPAGSPDRDGGDVLAWLQVSAAGKRAWENFVKQITSETFSWQDIQVLESLASPKKLLCRPVWVGNDGDTGAGPIAVSVEVFDGVWPAEADEVVAQAFGLDHQETCFLRDFLLGQLEGPALPQMLSQISAKAGAPGAAEMIRLVGFLLQERADDMAIAAGTRLPPNLLIRDDLGCETQCFRLGAETGQPVIFVHGMMDGIAGIQRLQPQLRTCGFRVYAPLRGGYGSTHPAPKPHQQLNAFVAQITALIEQENLQRPILLGHRSGAVFARAAALRLRDRIGGIVGVAPTPPLKQTSHSRTLQGYQRWLARSAWFAPALLPFVLKNWSRTVLKQGGTSLLRWQAKHGSKALAQIDAMDLDPVLGLSHALVMQQNGAGFLADMALAAGDWRRQMIGHGSSTIYLCGDEEVLTRQEGLYPMVVGAEKIQTRICSSGGNVLLYVCPELVLAALEELSSDKGARTQLAVS
jgi:pimeloyl-ACP methyl ester carboxylesterase